MIGIDPRLEQQYNNRAAVPDHMDYIRDWAERSAEWRRLSPPQSFRYGDTDRSWLDLFPVDGEAPVHVFLHGGYWQTLDRSFFSYLARQFQKRGEHAVILEYDLCPAVSLQAIVDQVRRAFEWMEAHLGQRGGDMSRLQVTGHSAGAQLLAWLVGNSQLPRIAIGNGLSGIYDLRPLVHTTVNEALQLDRRQAKALSPLFLLPEAGQDCRLELFVGERESDEYLRQSRRLREAWGGRLNTSLRVLPGAHHFSILVHWLEHGYRPVGGTRGPLNPRESP